MNTERDRGMAVPSSQ